MANWCSNSMIVYGNKKDIEPFYQRIKEETHLYDYFKEIGYTDEELNHMHIRGHIEYVELVEEDNKNSHVLIQYESAWEPCIEAFDSLLGRFYPNLNQVTIAEECGNEVYINTDTQGRYFIDKYYIDTCVNGNYWSEYYGYGQEDKLVEHYNELRKTHFKDLFEIKEDAEKFNDNHEDDFINIHEFCAC